MTYWILPWNKNVFNLPKCLEDFGFVEWRQRNKLAVGDIVFIYCSNPLKQIKYMMQVSKIQIPFQESVNDKYLFSDKYELKPTDFYARFVPIIEVSDNNENLSLDSLRKLGIESNLQGGIKVTNDILNQFLMAVDVVFDDLSQTFTEGKTHSLSVKAFERNEQARDACLKHYGYSCQICGINFEKFYGEIGENFIHVHHVDFISSFNGIEHKINPIEGLIPVCPNCHAMLHRKINGSYITPSELKALISK